MNEKVAVGYGNFSDLFGRQIGTLTQQLNYVAIFSIYILLNENTTINLIISELHDVAII